MSTLQETTAGTPPSQDWEELGTPEPAFAMAISGQ